MFEYLHNSETRWSVNCRHSVPIPEIVPLSVGSACNNVSSLRISVEWSYGGYSSLRGILLETLNNRKCSPSASSAHQPLEWNIQAPIRTLPITTYRCGKPQTYRSEWTCMESINGTKSKMHSSVAQYETKASDQLTPFHFEYCTSSL